MTGIERFYEISVEAGLNPGDRDEWMKVFNDPVNTVLWPINKGGKMIGGILFLHNTMHISVLPEWHGKWLTKSMLRGYKLWKHSVPIIAMIRQGDEITSKFVEMLGFKYQKEHMTFSFYSKEPTCQQ